MPKKKPSRQSESPRKRCAAAEQQDRSASASELRRKAEQRLRESEAKYRVLFEQAADSVVVFDPKTLAILDFNDEACRHLGYTHGEFAKLKICDIDVFEPAEEVKRHCQKVINTGLDVFETKHHTKGGAVLDIEVRSKAIRLGGEHLIQAVWRDVTARQAGRGGAARCDPAVAGHVRCRG